MAHKRTHVFLSLACWTLLAACGGGGANDADVPTAAAPPMPTPPAPSPPAPTVQFTIDNSIAETRAIEADGGRLELQVPGGARFMLDVPRGAFFATTTTIAMQSIVDTQGLPPGLTPIAAVSLGPAGADFAVQPTIEIDLRSLPRPVGNVVLFLANDDGSGLTYLLPQADDLVAAAVGDGPYRARVPHFSGVGIAVADPNGPGVAATPDAPTAEGRARQVINRDIEAQARAVLMGQRMLGEPIGETGPVFDAWRGDLEQRTGVLDGSAELAEVERLATEALRLEETRGDFVLGDRPTRLDESEVGLAIVRRFGAVLDTLNQRCIAGNADAPRLIRDGLRFLRDLASADLLNGAVLESLESMDACRQVPVQP